MMHEPHSGNELRGYGWPGKVERLRVDGRDPEALALVQKCIIAAQRLESGAEVMRDLYAAEAELRERTGDIAGSVNVLRCIADVSEDRVDWVRYALLRASQLAEGLGDFDCALAAALELATRYERDQSVLAREARIAALARAAEVSRRAGQLERAVDFAEEMERSFDVASNDSNGSRLKGSFASAMAMRSLERHDEAAALFDRVLALKGGTELADSGWFEAAALRFKADALAKLGREDELVQLAELLRVYGNDQQARTREQARRGLEEISKALALSDRLQPQLEVLELLSDVLSHGTEPDDSAEAGLVLFARAETLDALDRGTEADLVRKAAVKRSGSEMLVLLDRRISRLSGDTSPESLGQVAAWRLFVAVIRGSCGDVDGALDELRDLIEFYGDYDDPVIRVVVADAAVMVDRFAASR